MPPSTLRTIVSSAPTVWEQSGPSATRTVDTHVAKLRKKIEDDPAAPRHIVTVHRIGYRLVEPDHRGWSARRRG
jgi:DNA-binding winged helix-turn-helix (wHTH) protein